MHLLPLALRLFNVRLAIERSLRAPHALDAYGLRASPLGCRGGRGAQVHTALRFVSAGIPLVIQRSTVVMALDNGKCSNGRQATRLDPANR